jgi:hypothetical protein
MLRIECALGMRARQRRPADAQAFALATERIVCNVAAAWLVAPWRPIATPRSKHGTAAGALLDAMAAAGFISHHVGGWNAQAERVDISTSVPRIALLDYLPRSLAFRDLELAPSRPVPLRLKGEDGKPLPLPAEAIPLANEMHAVNDWLRSVPLSLEGCPEGWLAEEHGLPRVETVRHVELCRTFAGDLTSGGRMFGGFWIQKPKAWRFAHMRIDGEPPAECDYSELYLRLVYRHLGIVWPFPSGECGYTAGEGQRGAWKAMTNALIAAPRLPKNWPCQTQEELAELRSGFPNGTRYGQVLAAIRAKHSAIDARRGFGSGLGLKLMRTESDLCISSLLACRDAGIPALPLHDCLIAPSSQAENVASIMERTAFNALGVNLPVSIKR